MKKSPNKNYILKINIFVTFLVVFANILGFIFCNGNKSDFILITFYLNVFIFFAHSFIVSKLLKKKINEMKREALNMNYLANIATLFMVLGLLLVVSAIILYIVNKDAFKLAFIFTFFMSILTMLFSSIAVLSYTCIIFPSFILLQMRSYVQEKKDSISVLTIAFAIFLFLLGSKGLLFAYKAFNVEKQTKYKIIKLPVQYSTEYLKIKGVTDYGKKKLSREKVYTPFVYTAEAAEYEGFPQAIEFCESLGARLPNYLEMYNIAFNKFDTFGEKYYLTQNTDNKTPILIHFKDMSYTAMPLEENIKPLVYCVVSSKDNPQTVNRNFLYRKTKKQSKTITKSEYRQPFDDASLLEILGKDYQKPLTSAPQIPNSTIEKEIKHVNFSVKEVPSSYMSQLIAKGYAYNQNVKISSQYETNDFAFSSMLQLDPMRKNIKLCFYPFTDYGNMNLYEESQIWQQSFCSPAFQLIEQQPAIKSKYEKDAYCMSRGGRLPNIPELNGILRTLKSKRIGDKYWTNNGVVGSHSQTKLPVLVYYKDSRFMKVETIEESADERAYVYCVKKAKNPSKVIANYTSRFKGMYGSSYASAKCPTCQYYEVPDTVVSGY